MFRITENPSSGSLVQYLAKITEKILSCPLTWRLSVPTTSVSTDTIETFFNFIQVLYKTP